MQIERIRDHGYNSKGFYLGGKHHRKGLKRPIDAITLETVELSQNHNDTDFSWLKQYVKALPDDVAKERMKKHRDSFELIDDALIDALIIEEL
ncbi:MAG: hypothetical protein GX640_21405 [Fibrobacter sp.]|nr:hypothetical protein [Fibrobacter sp.]